MKFFRCALCIVTAVTCLLLPSTTFAADGMPLTLDEAITLALKNNRLIEQSAEDREIARWNLSAVRRNAGPIFSWSSSQYHIGGRYYRRQYRTPRDRVKAESDQYARDYGVDIGLNIGLYPNYNYESTHNFNLRMPVYTGGQLENQRESARYNLNAADLSLENSRQQVKFQAAQAYFRVLQQISAVDVQKEAVELLEEHLRNVTIQYEVGTVAKSDMLATGVQLANTRQALNTAQGNYQTAVAQLNNILGLPVDTELATSGQLNFVRYNLTESDCLEYALAHRPDAIAANFAVKRAEADTAAAKSGYRPSVSAVITGSVAGESPFSANHFAERWAVGFEMNWNIFDNGITSATVHQYQAAERRAESVALQQIELIQLEVHSAYIALQTAEKNIAVTSAAVDKAEEEFAIAQVRYVEGVDTNLNVMNAQEKVVETRNNYYAALYSYNTSRAQLEKAMGVPVMIDALIYSEAVQRGQSSPKSLAAAKVSNDYLDDRAWEFPLPFDNQSR